MNPKLEAAHARYHARVTACEALGIRKPHEPRFMKFFESELRNASRVFWQPDKKLTAIVMKPRFSGLRYVGAAKVEVLRNRNYSESPFQSGTPDTCGWYTNNEGISYKDGDGLVWGTVWRLKGQQGYTRLVAGCEFGGSRTHIIDFSEVFECGGRVEQYGTTDAMWDVAARADQLAAQAAEEEREYQEKYNASELDERSA